MPRARLLKPGFFTNDELLDIPIEGRLLFAGLWTIADRCGRLEDRPKRIKIELFPADNVDVDALLDALHQAGFIHRYHAQGQRLIHVKAFLSHQSPHPREPASKLPPCSCEEEEPIAQDASMGEKPSASNGPAMGQPPTGPSVAVAVAVADNGVLGSGSGSSVSSVAVTERDALYRRVCDSWLAQIGQTLAREPTERLVAAAERTSEQWVVDAIRETALAGAKAPKYALSILERWERDGREVQRPERSNGNGGTHPRRSTVLEHPDDEDPLAKRLRLDAERRERERQLGVS